MIFLNFPPGALGFLVVKSIHAAWPEHFAFEETPAGYAHNHKFEPDVFFSSHDSLHPAGLNWVIENQGNPGIVLMHNIDLLPKQLLQGNEVYNIYCDLDGLARSSFLSLTKNLDWHMDYITKNFEKIEDGLWAELYRYATFDNIPKFGKIIKFNEMGTVHSLQNILNSVHRQYGFSVGPKINNNWYIENYKRSTAPITENYNLYQIWQSCFIELKKQAYTEKPDRVQVLNNVLNHKWAHFSKCCKITWQSRIAEDCDK